MREIKSFDCVDSRLVAAMAMIVSIGVSDPRLKYNERSRLGNFGHGNTDGGARLERHSSSRSRSPTVRMRLSIKPRKPPPRDNSTSSSLSRVNYPTLLPRCIRASVLGGVIRSRLVLTATSSGVGVARLPITGAKYLCTR